MNKYLTNDSGDWLRTMADMEHEPDATFDRACARAEHLLALRRDLAAVRALQNSARSELRSLEAQEGNLKAQIEAIASAAREQV
jgi:hypothetical protein